MMPWPLLIVAMALEDEWLGDVLSPDPIITEQCSTRELAVYERHGWTALQCDQDKTESAGSRATTGGSK